jgi:uncharacterized membrane protein YesL
MMRPAEAGSAPGEGSRVPEAGEEAIRPRVSRALMLGLRGAYDYMGTVVVASIVWIGLALLLGVGGSSLIWQTVRHRGAGSIMLSLLGGLAAAGIGTGPLTAALFEHARRLMSHDDPDWRDLPVSVARLWQRGLGLAGLQVIVSLILLVDALFFLWQRAAPLHWLGAAFIYPILFWWSAALLQWPLAVERPAEPLLQVVKKSFLLILDNLGYAATLAAVVLLLTAFCLAWPIGWIGLTLAWAGILAFIQTAALRELLPKYGLLAAPASPPEHPNTEHRTPEPRTP